MSIYVNSTGSAKSSLSKVKDIYFNDSYYESSGSGSIPEAVIVTDGSGNPTLHFYNPDTPYVSDYIRLYADVQLSVDAPLDITYNDDEYSPRALSGYSAFLPAWSMSVDFNINNSSYGDSVPPLLALITPTTWCINNNRVNYFVCSSSYTSEWWTNIASGVWVMADSWGIPNNLYVIFFANCDLTNLTESNIDVVNRGGTVIVHKIPNATGSAQWANFSFAFKYGSSSTRKTLHMAYAVKNSDGTMSKTNSFEVTHNSGDEMCKHCGNNYIYEDEFKMSSKSYFQFWNRGKSSCKARLYVPKASRNKTNV